MENDDCDWVADCDDVAETSEIPIATKVRIIDIADKHPKWSLATLQKHGCADLSSKSKLKIWKQQIENGGTRAEKYRTINKYVSEMFNEARENARVVKTVNLKQLGIQKAREINALNVFKALNR